ncbi:MAG: acetyltransferase, partial [Bacteroidales bacterium]|nr:acetyltransferase [Bacteroidales bacterium]
MKLKDRINYRLLCGVIYPLSLLPLGVLYGLADVTAWLARVVVRYRRKVIMDNLRHAFPDRSEAELKRICHRFYRFL